MGRYHKTKLLDGCLDYLARQVLTVG